MSRTCLIDGTWNVLFAKILEGLASNVSSISVASKPSMSHVLWDMAFRWKKLWIHCSGLPFFKPTVKDTPTLQLQRKNNEKMQSTVISRHQRKNDILPLRKALTLGNLQKRNLWHHLMSMLMPRMAMEIFCISRSANLRECKYFLPKKQVFHLFLVCMSLEACLHCRH